MAEVKRLIPTTLHMEKVKVTKVSDKRSASGDRLVFIGLLAASFAILVGLISVTECERHLAWRAAIGSFAVSIPCLVLQAFRLRALETYGVDIRHPALDAAIGFGTIASLIGIGATFFHLAIWSGFVFATCALISLVIVLLVDSPIDSIQNANDKNDAGSQTDELAL